MSISNMVPSCLNLEDRQIKALELFIQKNPLTKEEVIINLEESCVIEYGLSFYISQNGLGTDIIATYGENKINLSFDDDNELCCPKEYGGDY